MEERRKKRSPRAQPAPAGAPRPLPISKSASFALPLPALPSAQQRARPRRSVLVGGGPSVPGAPSGAGGPRGGLAVPPAACSAQGEQGESEGRWHGGSAGGSAAAQLPH
uniref:Uncharacterized protein n=1 Tax=Anas zonorhyncha TaxID=75864 RepID=A0A8B9VJT2_9AVES